MEEWVGLWWHRAVTRAADRSHGQSAVALDEVRRSLHLLFMAGGGAPSIRVASSAERRHGGPRGWLQRVAGSGLRAAPSTLDTQVLALPPVVAVFDQRQLNRDLYLWLAALASVYEPRGDWIDDNRVATSRALQRFPGLRARHQRLVQAHLAQRPALQGLRGLAALWEGAVQAALRAMEHPPVQVDAIQVAPVCLWIEAQATATASDQTSSGPGGQRPDTPMQVQSAKRRQTNQVDNPDESHAFILPSRVESIRTWAEYLRVNRATDDEPDADALPAADDMDALSIAKGDKTTVARVKFDLDLPSAQADDLPLGPGRKTPEWDWRRGILVPDHCSLQSVVARPGERYSAATALQATARKMRRRFEVLRAAPRWQTGQTQGEAVDLDAWVRFHAETQAGQLHSDSPSVYASRRRNGRSLATLLLADLSLSTDAYANSQARVIDVIRDALYVFGEALAGTGDVYEILGFSSVRRQHVRIQHLKGFDEPWNDTVRSRVGALKPGYYTRMGAAIRDATRRLSARPEHQRLLLVLTDGKPNDLDVYDGRYGFEDTRHAVQAARDAGLTPFCVTIDSEAHAYLPQLFGQHGYAWVRRPEDLVNRLTQAWATLTC